MTWVECWVETWIRLETFVVCWVGTCIWFEIYCSLPSTGGRPFSTTPPVPNLLSTVLVHDTEPSLAPTTAHTSMDCCVPPLSCNAVGKLYIRVAHEFSGVNAPVCNLVCNPCGTVSLLTDPDVPCFSTDIAMTVSGGKKTDFLNHI